MQRPEKSQVEQSIMGSGKTTVVAPLLGLQIADSNHLMTYTVPNALITMFRNILGSRFNQIIQKRVHSFSIKRATELNDAILSHHMTKIQMARINQDVLTVTPDVPNCLLLKWLEIAQDVYCGNCTKKETLAKLEDILCQFIKHGVQLLEEADLVLAPSKSELNFTIGTAQSLEPGELRWTLSQFLIELLFTHEKLKTLLQQGLTDKHLKGFTPNNKFAFPRMELTNLDFYNHELKRALVNILLDETLHTDGYVRERRELFFIYLMADIAISDTSRGLLLRRSELTSLFTTNKIATDSFRSQQQVLNELIHANAKSITLQGVDYFLVTNTKMYYSTLHPLIADLCTAFINEYQRQATQNCITIILLKEWLTKFLPHIFVKKIFRVHYGPYFEIHKKGSTRAQVGNTLS